MKLANHYIQYCLTRGIVHSQKIVKALGVADERVLLVSVPVDAPLLRFLVDVIERFGIEELAINNTNLCDALLAPFLSALSTRPFAFSSLRSLELLDNKLSDSAYRYVADLLQALPAMKRVKLGGNAPMTLETAQIVRDAVAVHPSIIQLHVARTELTDDAAAALTEGATLRAAAIAKTADTSATTSEPSTFETLSVCSTGAAAATCRALSFCADLHNSNAIGFERIRMRHCKLGSACLATTTPNVPPAPISFLATSLQRVSVRRLCLDHCGLTFTDTADLFKGVVGCRSLVALSLRCNALTTAGVKNVLCALKGRMMEELCLDGCGVVGEVNLRAVGLEYSGAVPQVQSLSLEGNVGMKLSGGLAEAAVAMRTSTLKVGGCETTPGDVEAFADALMQLRKVRGSSCCVKTVDLAGASTLDLGTAARVLVSLFRAGVERVVVRRCVPSVEKDMAAIAKEITRSLPGSRVTWRRGEVTLDGVVETAVPGGQAVPKLPRCGLLGATPPTSVTASASRDTGSVRSFALPASHPAHKPVSFSAHHSASSGVRPSAGGIAWRPYGRSPYLRNADGAEGHPFLFRPPTMPSPSDFTVPYDGPSWVSKRPAQDDRSVDGELERGRDGGSPTPSAAFVQCLRLDAPSYVHRNESSYEASSSGGTEPSPRLSDLDLVEAFAQSGFLDCDDSYAKWRDFVLEEDMERWALYEPPLSGALRRLM